MPSDFRKILEKSSDVNAQDERGNTALHVAILNQRQVNCWAVSQLLEREDVDVNRKNNQHQTALHLASQWWYMRIDLFKIILDKSSDVDAQDKFGRTALHWAIVKESETAVNELLNHKDVDVNLKDNDNQTALHFAAKWVDIPNDFFGNHCRKIDRCQRTRQRWTHCSSRCNNGQV
jgi:ankyrin repeat protein